MYGEKSYVEKYNGESIRNNTQKTEYFEINCTSIPYAGEKN